MPRKLAPTVAMERLLELVEDGHLQPGQRLPAEREIADMLEVSRSSLREALAALRAMGVVDIRHGQGTFVSKNAELRKAIQSFSAVLLKDITFGEFTDVRQALEVETSRLATERASEEELQTLRAYAEGMLELSVPEDFASRDLEFHRRIAHLSKNRLWAHVVILVDSILREEIQRVVTLPGRMHTAGEEHVRIVDAMQERDFDLVASRVRDHLKIYADMFEAKELVAGGGESRIDISAKAQPL